MREEKLPLGAAIAPFAGLVPLVFGCGAVLAPSSVAIDPIILQRAVIGYAALYLAFLGGVRWGFLVAKNERNDRRFLLGALGSLLGLVALLLPLAPALALLSVGFAGQGAWDVWSGWRKTMPEIYQRHRALITLLVCLILVSTLLVYAAQV